MCSTSRKLYLFFILLFVISTINGVCMGLTVYFDRNVSSLGIFQMMIPATVTFLTFMISSR